MIVEVKLEDLEKKYNEITFGLRMDAAKGGNWKDDFSKDKIEDYKNLLAPNLTDDWTALIDAATVGDQESGKFKVNHAAFIIRGVRQGFILLDDVYKYEEYLDIFNRNRNQFAEKDLGQYKDQGDYSYFTQMAVGIKYREEDDVSSAKGVSKKDKFKKLLVHQSNGFSMYKIPERKDMDGKENAYYNASCELGSGTEWCTATGRTKDYFDQYTREGALFIFINDGAPDEKYQYSPAENQFMDRFDDDILNTSSTKAILDRLKGGLEWIDKNEPGGLSLHLKMVMGAPIEEVKKILNFTFDVDTEDEWVHTLFEDYFKDYLMDAQAGNWDNDGVVKKYFKDKQLSPYNANNWLELLKLSQQIFGRLINYGVDDVMHDLLRDYRLADLSSARGGDQFTKPYLPLFYEEVIKKALDVYLEGNTIEFDYEGIL